MTGGRDFRTPFANPSYEHERREQRLEALSRGYVQLVGPRVMTYVHYTRSPIVGEWVLPWDELPDHLRTVAGHEGRVHAERFRDQWRSDRVYVHKLPPGHPFINIGTGYSTRESWAYEVDPIGELYLDPERGGHLVTSRTCERARVIRCLHAPSVSGGADGEVGPTTPLPTLA